MELRQLEYFVAVVEEASFTRAAARVLVAQSGVSAQVRRLERELGVELLDRGSRSVTLTEAGAAVLPFARDALAAVAGVRSAVEELTGLLRGHVRIGMLTAGPAVLVDRAAGGLPRGAPGRRDHVDRGGFRLAAGAVRAGELDLAVRVARPASPRASRRG